MKERCRVASHEIGYGGQLDVMATAELLGESVNTGCLLSQYHSALFRRTVIGVPQNKR
jgi:hypothetical protein